MSNLSRENNCIYHSSIYLNFIINNDLKIFYCNICHGINLFKKNEISCKTISFFNNKQNTELINSFLLYEQMIFSEKNNKPKKLQNDNDYELMRKNSFELFKGLEAKYKTTEDTFFLAVLYLDIINSQIKCSLNDWELLSVACFFIAAKFIENDAYLGSFSKLIVNFNLRNYSTLKFRESEFMCLKYLQYNIGRITAKQYLDIMSHIGFTFDDEIVYFFGNFEAKNIYQISYTILREFICEIDSTQFASKIIAFTILIFIREFYLILNTRNVEYNNTEIEKFVNLKRQRKKLFEKIYKIKPEEYRKCYESLKIMRNVTEVSYTVFESNSNIRSYYSNSNKKDINPRYFLSNNKNNNSNVYNNIGMNKIYLSNHKDKMNKKSDSLISPLSKNESKKNKNNSIDVSCNSLHYMLHFSPEKQKEKKFYIHQKKYLNYTNHNKNGHNAFSEHTKEEKLIINNNTNLLKKIDKTVKKSEYKNNIFNSDRKFNYNKTPLTELANEKAFLANKIHNSDMKKLVTIKAHVGNTYNNLLNSSSFAQKNNFEYFYPSTNHNETKPTGLNLKNILNEINCKQISGHVNKKDLLKFNNTTKVKSKTNKSLISINILSNIKKSLNFKSDIYINKEFGKKESKQSNLEFLNVKEQEFKHVKQSINMKNSIENRVFNDGNNTDIELSLKKKNIQHTCNCKKKNCLYQIYTDIKLKKEENKFDGKTEIFLINKKKQNNKINNIANSDVKSCIKDNSNKNTKKKFNELKNFLVTYKTTFMEKHLKTMSNKHTQFENQQDIRNLSQKKIPNEEILKKTNPKSFNSHIKSNSERYDYSRNSEDKKENENKLLNDKNVCNINRYTNDNRSIDKPLIYTSQKSKRKSSQIEISDNSTNNNSFKENSNLQYLIFEKITNKKTSTCSLKQISHFDIQKTNHNEKIKITNKKRKYSSLIINTNH